MSLFLAAYLTIYGGIHLYLWFRTVRAFDLHPPWSPLLGVLCAFMVAAPIIVRLLQRHDAEGAARAVAYVGYTWMGCIFLFFSASVAIDLLRGVLWTGAKLLGREIFQIPSAAALSVSLVLAVAAATYGFFDARKLRVEHVTVKTQKLPKRVRVVQLSDVHLGLVVGRERLLQILQEVIAAQPDLLVCTGDLIDGQVDGLQGLDEVLQQVKPPLGKFAVTGNHEAIAGIAPSVGFIRRSGFTLLRGDAAHMAGALTVTGVDDPFIHSSSPISEPALLKALPREKFILLLKHRPAVHPDSRGLFDLQLSGHVHKGQIFPFNLLTHLFYPAPMGLSSAGPGSHLYVSRGTGTWGPPMRVLAPPEITIVDIVPQEG
ncbi:metallophosphoesterase [Geomonas sp. RF6]|uniref:metallophosphoesterase n=1 Tax=Geomonas sp. RF6 TaxID=2897342 RepID=UPI001E35B6AA|nr:metallophosphoesterase [Geomonas sp. RF6]UFS68620.1 metallophosphoesterase [Geomonas sp. RF6]